MPGVAERRIGTVGPGAPNLMGEERERRPESQKNRVGDLHQKIFDASTAQEDWRPRAIESYQMTGNRQWSDADVEAREKDERPIITINKILPKVMFLSGVQRQQRTEPSFTPVEGNDVRTAEVIRALYKYHQQKGRIVEEQSKIFEDKIVCGIGWDKVVLRFDQGDIEGRPTEVRRHPLSIFPDPNFWDGGREQMMYIVDCIWATRQQAQKRWPKHADEIAQRWGEWINNAGAQMTAASTGTTGESLGDSQADQRFFWDPDEQRVRIAEVWELEVEHRAVALMPDGNLETDENVVRRIKAAILLSPELANEIVITKAPVRTVTVTHLLDDLVLSDKRPSPFDEPELPFFPTICHYYWRYPFGIVEPMKDLQREKNVRRCAIIDMVRRAPNTGWLNDATNGAKTEEIERYAKGSGVVINHHGAEPKRIEPPSIPQTLAMLENQSDSDMDEVSVINAEMTGLTTQKTVSGRAIEARQRGGLTVQESILESFRLDMQPAARFMVKAIQQYVSLGKAMKIIGQMAAVPGAEQNLQAIAAEQMELQAILENSMATEFDVLIRNEQPYEPSLKAQNLETLNQIAQNNPQTPPPPKIMIRAMKEAGVITDQDATEWLAMIQQMQQAPPPGPPPEGMG